MNTSSQDRSIQYKTPLEIMQQSYLAETITRMFRYFPLSFPVGIKETEIANQVTTHLESFHYKLASKGYRGFPANISISRNWVVTHGVPSEKEVQNNDILTIDIIGKYNGWHADMSWTYYVGTPSEDTLFLLDAAWKVCRAGINAVKTGNTLRDVAMAIRNEADKHKVYVYNQFVGHGIGSDIHELPFVRYDKKAEPIPIVPGMVLCIEPIVSLKAQRVERIKDGSYIGVKHFPTAVYEHMVAVYERESRVLSWGMQTPVHLPLQIVSL